MSSNSNKNNNKNTEEVFLTLLQRIQRQYNNTTSSNSSNNNDNQINYAFIERPPDEAAAALGRQLALTLDSMPTITKGIQEKALVALSNRQVNPSIVRGFFDTLLQQNQQQQQKNNNNKTTNNKSEKNNMDWLPYWICHTEASMISSASNDAAGFASNSVIAPNYDALTAMIRSYAQYKSNQTTMSTNTTSTTTTTAGTNATGTGVATTFRRLQTSGARIAMLREFTKAAFTVAPAALNSKTSVITTTTTTTSTTITVQQSQLRSLLSPLVAASLLSTQTDIHESLLFLQDIWRWADSIARKQQFQRSPREDKTDLLLDLLLWMTNALDLFLWGIPSRKDGESSSSSLHQQQHQQQQQQHPLACKEMAHRWLLQLVDLGCTLSQQQQQQQTTTLPKLQTWTLHILSNTLPRLFAIVPSYRIPMDDILSMIRYRLLPLPNNKNTKQQPLLQLDAAATLRLATVVMASPIPEDTNELLAILAASVHLKQPKTVAAILRGLASIHLRDPICGPNSTELLQALGRVHKQQQQQVMYTKSSSSAVGGGGAVDSSSLSSSSLREKPITNLIQFLDQETVDVDNFVAFLSRPDLLGNSRLTAIQQTGALLVGVAMLKGSDFSSSPPRPAGTIATTATALAPTAYPYLENVLSIYPHLGIRILPVIVDSINAASLIGDGATTLKQLEFLCTSVVKDMQCAREVWNLLGVELMKASTSPPVLRASLIRLFPKICKTNKRLYKRVIEALGNTLAASNNPVEIRLAVIATIAELAEEDRIRDVTDVIGWIQSFIEDGGWNRPGSTLDKHESAGKAVLVHYAILSLHYLVVAQELDYNLVLVVLGKRLCNVHDMSETIKLPLLVIEALAMLLGDGECDDDDDSDEDDQPKPVGVAPHVSKSVETLLNLALSPKLDPTLASDRQEEMRRGTLYRCRRNIYDSLSRYSVEGLGIDEDGVKAVCMAYNVTDPPAIPKSGIRYSSIKTIVEEGIRLVTNNPVDTSTDTNAPEIEVGIQGYEEDAVSAADVSSSLASLISKLLLLEEDVLGSTLWQKRGGATKKTRRKQLTQFHTPMDDALARALPSPTTVQQIYNQNRCTATSLAALLCFEGKPLALYADLAGDIANESTDPTLRAFTVQASLNAAQSVLKQLVLTLSSSEGLEQILLEIRDWRFRLDNADNMFLALASLALYIPDILGPYGDHSPYVDEICEDIWDAYNNHDFEKNDIGKLCLGFIGVCAVRSRNLERLGEIVNTLEKCITSYGGQASFGAYYALAVIAQSCPELQSDERGNESDDLGFTSRIVGFLVGELVSCIKGNHEILASLVACIKREEITPEAIDSLTLLSKKSMNLFQTKKQNAKSLFIALALCLPALTSINDELLLGVYCMLENLPWGSGKGIALPSVLHACRNSGLFESKEIEKIYAKYASVFEEGMDKGVAGLDDIFYAVTATVTKTIPITIRRFLVGNRTLFNEEGRANSLLAAAVSLSSVPCLGCGAQRFTDSPQLSPNASEEDVKGVATLMSEAASSKDWNIYSQVAVLLTGFMASIKNGVDPGGDASTRSMTLRPRSAMDDEESRGLQLPTAQEGTVLDVLMRTLILHFDKPNLEATGTTSNGLVQLIGCLGVLSLPGHFAAFLEQMFRGTDKMKIECVKLLVSQIRGRPRAVFDGKDYINLALKLSTIPVSNLRTLLGHGDAIRVFIESFAEILPRLPSGSVEEAVENVWRLCINQVGQYPAWTASFLASIKTVLKCAVEQKAFSVAPKTLSSVRIFLLKRGFAGIRDAPWATTTSSNIGERSIVEMYVDCLMEMPITSLIEAEFFALKDLDGFIGEALRNRCVMILVRQGYFTTPSRASSEIASSLAWFSRQLISSEDEIYSSTLLQVSCAIAEATSLENSDRKRELLLTLLDNLLLTSASASIVGLQMLGALVYQWCQGAGSDGDMSLACICAYRMEKWHEFSPPSLQQIFRLIVHDLPFNLASYSRREKLSNVVFNRLWRVYKKWLDEGADQETTDCVRKSLICCQSAATDVEDFASIATSMLL